MSNRIGDQIPTILNTFSIETGTGKFCSSVLYHQPSRHQLDKIVFLCMKHNSLNILNKYFNREASYIKNNSKLCPNYKKKFR